MSAIRSSCGPTGIGRQVTRPGGLARRLFVCSPIGPDLADEPRAKDQDLHFPVAGAGFEPATSPAAEMRRAGCVLAALAPRRQVPTHPPPVVRAWTSAVEDDSTDPGFGCELSHVARVATAAWPRRAGGPSRPGVRGGVGGEKDADRSVGQAV